MNEDAAAVGLLDPLFDTLPDDLWLQSGVGFAILVVIAAVAFWLTRVVVLRLVTVAVAKSKTDWDDALLDRGFFGRVAAIAPLLVFQALAGSLVPLPELAELVARLSSGITALIGASAAAALLGTVADVFDRHPKSEGRFIKGYTQLVSLLVYILAVVFAVAELLDRSAWGLLTGVGAATAVLLLVFKDTILSFVASIQLASYDMMKIGDWISLPQFGADGAVVDISLHTVKVQNWDKTISTIPTHNFISTSFKNWRAMSEGDGRRIKRSIRVDLNSVRFLTDEEIDRFAEIDVLRDYVADKRAALDEANAGRNDLAANRRNLTNVGTFRAYLAGYLRATGRINTDMTFIVRQLPPDPQGLPIQIYCFTATTVWADYEAIQADLFDHLLAVLPEFGLRAFQSPTGADFRALDAR